MRLSTRKVLDGALSGLGIFSITIMAAALLVILAPMFRRGAGAFVFRGTVEHRRVLLNEFGTGNASKVNSDIAMAEKAREPVYRMLSEFEENDLAAATGSVKRDYREALADLKHYLHKMLGPFPGDGDPALPRDKYGDTRMDQALETLDHILMVEEWDYSDKGAMGTLVKKPRVEGLRGTSLEPLFEYMEENLERMLLPKLTFYPGFIYHGSLDAHIFGGIWAEVLGTLYLTIGAMLFAVPFGIIAAVYFCEYAHEGRIISFLRICVSTLAGVPSIVFGLFGLAFFINTVGVSETKSVLAGSLTLGLLVLPTVIRAAEEAIRAVPRSYKEAALSVGASQWHTIVSVILPAALPGILTGVVISMGRAAGETAPIIFTAAVSFGNALAPWDIFSKGTPALSWNIYNLATEHEAADQIRHVQFGMVLTLVSIVLLLNVAAIVLRARVSKKLKG